MSDLLAEVEALMAQAQHDREHTRHYFTTRGETLVPRLASELRSVTNALNEKVQHHLDDHGDCGGYVQTSERKNALYARDRRENDVR